MSDGVRYTCPSCGRHVGVFIHLHKAPWCSRCDKSMVTMWDIKATPPPRRNKRLEKETQAL